MKGIAFVAIIGTAYCAVIHTLGEWYRSHDVDYEEGSFLPKGWCVWGTCRSWGNHNPQYDMRYFVLRIPSWSWELDYCQDRYAFFQRALVRFNGKWSMRFLSA